MTIKLNTPSILISNIIVLSFFVVEAFMKITQRSDLSIYVSIAIKAAILVSLIYFILKRKNFTFFYAIGCLAVIYAFGHFSSSKEKTIDNILLFTRYITPLIFFAAYNLIPAKHKGNMFNIFKWILVFNSGLILLGFLVQIELFRTYSGSRFGFNGLFFASATGTYIYCLYIIYLTNRFRKNGEIGFWNIVVVLSSLLIGTKTIYLVLFFSFLYLLYVKLKRYRILTIATISTLLIIGFISLVKSSSFYLDFINKHEVITIVLSKRDLLFTENTLPYIKNYWSFINYLFGGLHGLSLRSQMALVDLILIFGFVGSFFYLWLYKKLYFNFKFRKLELAGYILVTLVTLLAGNFFMYTFTQLTFLIYKDLTIKINN